MSRRTNAYFVIPKWNYAPAARRAAGKAIQTLAHAKDRLWQTCECMWCGKDCTCKYGLVDIDRPTAAAMEILEQASMRVAQWEQDMHNAEAARQGQKIRW